MKKVRKDDDLWKCNMCTCGGAVRQHTWCRGVALSQPGAGTLQQPLLASQGCPSLFPPSSLPLLLALPSPCFAKHPCSTSKPGQHSTSTSTPTHCSTLQQPSSFHNAEGAAVCGSVKQALSGGLHSHAVCSARINAQPSRRSTRVTHDLRA